MVRGPLEEIDDNDNDNDLDDARWYFYRYICGDCPAQPGFLATTNRQRSKLIDIINEITTMMYTTNGLSITAPQVLMSYTKLITWRKDLPTSIGDIENGSRLPLPHVLSLL